MNEVAGEGEIFVCVCCGRLSKDRWGKQKIHHGWDTSCMTHAVKYKQGDLILDPKTKCVVGLRNGAVPIMERPN
jgi:hypothetical protein